MTDKYLDGIYDHRGPQGSYYDRWADTYDSELHANDYATPRRIAEALATHLAARDMPVLDFACGTGLSGVALAEAGFTAIDGYDISKGMLEQAARKGIYRDLILAEEGAEPAFDATYSAIIACGAIGPGAAPATLIAPLVAALPLNGLFVMSLNDHGLSSPEFTDPLAELEQNGTAERLFAEHGPHLPKLDLGATVFVYRRT